MNSSSPMPNRRILFTFRGPWWLFMATLRGKTRGKA